MLDEKYLNQINGDDYEIGIGNLFSVFEAYYRENEELEETEWIMRNYNEVICPYINPRLSAVEYANSSVLLKRLFQIIISKECNGDEELFNRVCRPFILDPLVWYLRDLMKDSEPFFGSWFLSEDYPGGIDKLKDSIDYKPEDAIVEYYELSNLLEDAVDASSSGEELAYALILLYGLSIVDIQKLRYQDIVPIAGTKSYALSLRGSFPKLSETLPEDKMPRMVPLPDALYDVFMERKYFVEKALIRDKLFGPAKLSIPVNGKRMRADVKVGDLPLLRSDMSMYIPVISYSSMHKHIRRLVRQNTPVSPYVVSILDSELTEDLGEYKKYMNGCTRLAFINHERLIRDCGLSEKEISYIHGDVTEDGKITTEFPSNEVNMLLLKKEYDELFYERDEYDDEEFY